MEGSRFIGGAEKARRRARKIKHKKPASGRRHHHGQRKNTNDRWKPQRLPNKISPPDRFFASLLLTSVEELVESNGNSDENWRHVIGDICDKAGVPFPTEMQAKYQESHEFFGMRASLVLEESRCILADAIMDHMKSRHPCGIDVRLLGAQEKKHGFVSLTFRKNSSGYRSGDDEIGSFTPSEMYNMKPGNVLQVNYCHANGVTGSILTSVVPSSNSDDRSVTLMAYRSQALNEDMYDSVDINIIPIANLISEQRQFVACFSKPNVPFLSKLMGAKSATHTRFDYSDDDDESDCDDREEKKEEEVDATYNEGDSNCMDEIDDHMGSIPLSAIDVPKLNTAQETAAISFLHGPHQNLSLVQGPPGTGKTQFLTAILIRTFLRDYSPENLEGGYCRFLHDKRVLVTAPTNKAISVIASRFLRAINGYIGLNVILIGVEDALFPTENYDDDDDIFSSLRSVFLYTWIEELAKDFRTLKLSLHGKFSQQDVDETLECAEYLVLKMKKGVPVLCKTLGSLELAENFISCLREIQGNDMNKIGASHIEDANEKLSELIASLAEIQKNEDPASELLGTANIIFSTLSSSGVSLMKRTSRINELFVDEAAAATEPEILIPLHLRPSRMLAVGDPKQLPATITSKRAVNLGLDRSLLDRLMYHCGEEHLMLDTQYRMKPDISSFPNNSFYDGRLENGNNVTCPTYKGSVSILNSNPYTFIQVNGKESRAPSGSYYNMHEAKAVVQIVEQIRKSSIASDQDHNWSSLESLRIITFYAGQVRAIKDLLRQRGLGQVTVATVDSSQGSESDIVIVSFVRCNGRSGFLQDDRRINVALTRARFQLICIGDANNTLMKSEVKTLRGLANDAKDRNLLQSSDVLGQNIQWLIDADSKL